jgi:hypothetical protein
MGQDRDDSGFGRDGDPRQDALIPELVEPNDREQPPGWGARGPFGDRDSLGGMLFGPRSFRGGRIQVYGCSPGCLILSLAVSVIASILLTLLLNAIL